MKSTWRRFSLRSVFVGITLLGVVLATRQYVVLGALLGATVAMAGVVAVLIRRSFRSSLIGGLVLGALVAGIMERRHVRRDLART